MSSKTQLTLKEIEKIKARTQKRDYGKIFKVFVLPIFSLLFFFGMIFIIVLPKISSLFSQVEDLQALSAELDLTNAKATNIQTLLNQSANIQTDLEKIEKIAPSTNTEVVNFQETVEMLARSNNLNSTNVQLSDTDVLPNEAETNPISLRKVPNNFTLTGELPDIVNFLKNLGTESDFIVTEQMELTYRGNVGDWELKAILAKYQFSENAVDIDQLYLNVPIEAKPSPLVQEFLNEFEI